MPGGVARDARDMLRDARKLLSRDIDPGEKRKTEEVERRETNANTFQLVANEWFQTNKSRWVESYSVRLRSRLIHLVACRSKRESDTAS